MDIQKLFRLYIQINYCLKIHKAQEKSATLLSGYMVQLFLQISFVSNLLNDTLGLT